MLRLRESIKPVSIVMSYNHKRSLLALINSRPLTYIGAEPNDLKVLTPAQILIGRNLQAFPSKDTKVTEQTSNALKKRLKYHQRLVNGFWKRWNAEYLKSLMDRYWSKNACG